MNLTIYIVSRHFGEWSAIEANTYAYARTPNGIPHMWLAKAYMILRSLG